MAAANVCNQLWNLGANEKVQKWWITENASIVVPCFLLQVELELCLIRNIKVLKCCDRF